MVSDTVTHREAVIQHFMEDVEFAELYLPEVRADCSPEEISKVQGWYDEAKARSSRLDYWSSLVENAEQTARDGKNLETVIGLVSRALAILKTAVPASA